MSQPRVSHPLCCDCDDCLNGSGGLVLPGAGVTHVTELAGLAEEARRKERESARRHYASWKKRRAA